MYRNYHCRFGELYNSYDQMIKCLKRSRKLWEKMIRRVWNTEVFGYYLFKIPYGRWRIPCHTIHELQMIVHQIQSEGIKIHE